MFSVMLDVAIEEQGLGEGGGGAFRDNNMHKEQCIGPGHRPVPGGFQCVSVAASINRFTTASSW